MTIFFNLVYIFRGSEVKQFYGESLAFGAIQGDWCDIRCVSHDIELCEHIKEVWGKWRWLETKINHKYPNEDEEGHRLVVVVGLIFSFNCLIKICPLEKYFEVCQTSIF